MHIQSNKLVSVVAGAFALALTACTTTEGVIQTGPAAEVTFDGLHRVDGTGRVEAWVNPDISLAAYSKILPVRTGVQYRTVKTNKFSGSEFELSEKQRAKLEQLLEETFAEELQKSKYFTFTDEAGPDVVIMEAGLIDVVSKIPPESIGRSDIYLRTLGEATLVIELKDSVSGETLVRAVERRKAENPADELRESSIPANIAQVRRDARQWARSLREALDKLHEL